MCVLLLLFFVWIIMVGWKMGCCLFLFFFTSVCFYAFNNNAHDTVFNI